MSNQQVGGIYQQIINDVIAASRVDFEEGGIDEAVLEQLRKTQCGVVVGGGWTGSFVSPGLPERLAEEALAAAASCLSLGS
ncbi:hypothetical protein O1611_g10454 [Lasiodiplodia mahajangana]|uniref:Uncharacterized protein n=1 Tax=Lasiodiplodia mahajangana TaxID=1108764 RepID=A0ACC2IYB7_9PEZI|nr:hypothetical protein O1611_g10454 [Lasiodiplodia mahajangana]